MPSPYLPPDVQVTQNRRTSTAPRIAPQLPVCVVGPCRQLEFGVVAGEYSAGAELNEVLPNLAAGAIVHPDSLRVYLDAVDTVTGAKIGSYELSTDSTGGQTEARLVNDNTMLQIPAVLDAGLSFSLYSGRNNDLTTDNDDRATGTSDGIWFTDRQVDYRSMGVREGLADGSTLVISTPAESAGRYLVLETGKDSRDPSRITRLRVGKLGSDDELEVHARFVPNANIDAGISRIYGFTDIAAVRHVWGLSDENYGYNVARTTDGINGWLTNGPAGTFDISGLVLDDVRCVPSDESTIKAFGLGVEECPVVIDGPAGVDITNLFTTNGTVPAPVNFPSTKSGATLKIQPAAPATAGTPYGINTPLWKSLVNAAQVGDWIRLKGSLGLPTIDTSSVFMVDYQITAVDKAAYTVTVRNPDATSSAATTIAASATTVTQLALLRCYRGTRDSNDVNGDYVRFTVGTTVYESELLRATPSFIELVDGLPAGVTGATVFEFHRGVRTYRQELAYDLIQIITTGYHGTVRVDYRADRTDLSVNGLMALASDAEIEDRLGMIHPDNPLAFAAAMVARSGSLDGATVFYALATSGDNIDAYGDAMQYLVSEDVYYVVPCSQESSVRDLFTNHVTSQSRPENKHERRVFLSSPLPTIDPVLPEVPGTAPLGSVVSTGSGPYVVDALQFTSADTSLDWNLVHPGNVLKILEGDQTTSRTVVERRIRTVDVATRRLTFYEALPTQFADPDLNSSTPPPQLWFKIDTYPRSRQEQAEAWRDEAASIGNQRVCMVRPHEGNVVYTDRTTAVPRDLEIVAPGWAICAALAGYLATVAPGQPITNQPVSAVTRLFYSNTYFTPDQLNTIAEGGNLVLTQNTRGARPTIRHQLTTDMTSIELRELSINIAVDYTAKYMRAANRPYIGKRNITAELLAQLRGINEGIMRALIEGRVLAPTSRLTSLLQSSVNPDEIEIEVDVKVNYPCNRISIKLNV